MELEAKGGEHDVARVSPITVRVLRADIQRLREAVNSVYRIVDGRRTHVDCGETEQRVASRIFGFTVDAISDTRDVKGADEKPLG